ncbi:MAG: tetratricopeptide repeat protein [Desulfovibrio sp.]
MTTTDRPGGPNASGRMVLAFLGFALAVIFVGSFIYRMQRPSLEVRQQPKSGMGEAMGQAMNGPMKEIMALMQKLKENPDDPELQLTMAERFMAMGAFDRAKTFLDKVAKVRPDDPETQNAMGVVLYNLKDVDGAKAAFEGVLAKHPKDFRALFNLGLLYKYALKEPDKAAEAFKTVLAAPDVDPDTRATAQRELESKVSQ